MFGFRSMNVFLALLISSQVWSQQNQESTQLQSETKYLEYSSNTSQSNLHNKEEEVLDLKTGGYGEVKADINKVVLWREFDTPNRIRVKMKAPLFRYKPIFSGTSYYVETTKEVKDEKTGLMVRVKDIQKKRLVWCGLEPCLLSSNLLLRACVRDQKTCSSAYDTIIIDFSKAAKLEIGENELFFLSAYQRKIPGDAIDFFLYPLPGKTIAPRYIIEHKKKMFGPDVYVVRQPTQKELDKEQEKEQKIVTPTDVLDIENSSEINEKSTYTKLLTNIGMPGQTANPNGQSNNQGNDQSNQTNGQKSSAQVTEEWCIDPITNKVVSKKSIIEGKLQGDLNSDSRTEVTKTILESSENIKNIENNVSSKACLARKQNMVLNVSLAGQKNVIQREKYIQQSQASLNLNIE